MKIIALFIAATVAVLLPGCSKQEQQRAAAMRKQFAEIDSAFAAHIAAVNSNEQFLIAEQLRGFSNRVLSVHLSLTNVELAANELETADDSMKAAALLDFVQVHFNSEFTNQMLIAELDSGIVIYELGTAVANETGKTMWSIKFVQAVSDTKRSEFTNQMLLAKLNWFYTNSMPTAEDVSSGDTAEIVQNLATTLCRNKVDEIKKAGLDYVSQMPAAKLAAAQREAASRPLTEEEIRAQKKQAILDEQARQQVIAAQNLAARREADAVKTTAHIGSGWVFQVTGDGMLVKWSKYSDEGDLNLGFVQDVNTAAFTDGEPFKTSVLYPIGTYRYDTAAGSTKTVRRFTTSLERAIQYHRNPQ